MLERISDHLLATVAVAAVVSAAFGAADAGLVDPELASAIHATALPEIPHGVVGSFIGLLLAFRTSQAYDRFWEARTLWDGVYSHCRSIVRLASAIREEDWRSSGGDLSTATATATTSIVGLTAAFPYALKQHLRGVNNVQELVAAATAASDCPRQSPTTRQLAAAAQQPNVPLAVLDRLSRTLLQLRRPQGDVAARRHVRRSDWHPRQGRAHQGDGVGMRGARAGHVRGVRGARAKMLAHLRTLTRVSKPVSHVCTLACLCVDRGATVAPRADAVPRCCASGALRSLCRCRTPGTRRASSPYTPSRCPSRWRRT